MTARSPAGGVTGSRSASSSSGSKSLGQLGTQVGELVRPDRTPQGDERGTRVALRRRAVEARAQGDAAQELLGVERLVRAGGVEARAQPGRQTLGDVLRLTGRQTFQPSAAWRTLRAAPLRSMRARARRRSR